MSAAVVGRVDRARLADLVALTKPRITLMVTATGVAGALAARRPLSLAESLGALAGTAFVVGGANALNMWFEADTDARMERTRDRPLAAGRLPRSVGLLVGLVLAIASMPLLAIAGVDVALLGLAALVVYAAIYTPLKRVTRWALPVGALAGAAPPLMGWVTATHRPPISSAGLDAPGLYLFAVLFAWQLPHFVAIAIFRGDEYANAGLVVGRSDPRGRTLLASAVAFVLTLVAAPLFGFPGRAHLAVCAVTGAALLALSARVAYGRAPREAARDAFAYSMAHLAVVLVSLGALTR